MRAAMFATVDGTEPAGDNGNLVQVRFKLVQACSNCGEGSRMLLTLLSLLSELLWSKFSAIEKAISIPLHINLRCYGSKQSLHLPVNFRSRG